MSPTIWPQPLVVVRDVPVSSRFYTEVLGAESGHGGDEYEQIVRDGEIVLQLHHIDVEDHHGPLASHDVPLGNGALLWFELADFDAAVERARRIQAVVSETYTSIRTPGSASSGYAIRTATWSCSRARRSTAPADLPTRDLTRAEAARRRVQPDLPGDR